MADHKFSKGEALRFGWSTFKSNMGFFIILAIVYLLLMWVPYYVATMITELNVFLGLLFRVADIAKDWLMCLGLIKISLDLHDGQQPRLIDLLSQYPLLIKFAIGIIIYLLIVISGMVLLIIPGIIWSLKYWFFDYLIVDQGLGPIESLKRSAALTKGAKTDFFIFSLLLLLINIAGALCLLLGLFVTIPVSMVAVAFVYRKLLEQDESLTTGLSAS